MKQCSIHLLAVASVLAAGVAIAAPATTPDVPAVHAKLDVNGDGVIDRAEAAARPHFAQKFDQLDRNHDGRIDASERPQHGGRGGHGFARLDVNNDGAIDRAEAAARPRFAQKFDQLDRNHDGRIDASERPQRGMHGGHRFARLDVNNDGAIDRAEAAKIPGFAQKFDQLDRNRDGRIDASERPRHGMRDGKGGHGGIARLDADGDGRLSRAEAGNSPMAKRFDQLDLNKDGFVDREEARQAMQRWRAEHGRTGPAQNGVGSGGTGHH